MKPFQILSVEWELKAPARSIRFLNRADPNLTKYGKWRPAAFE
jgi:hypothetical protein